MKADIVLGRGYHLRIHPLPRSSCKLDMLVVFTQRVLDEINIKHIYGLATLRQNDYK